MTEPLSRKPKRTGATHKAKAEAMAAVTKGPQTRLNTNVDKRKYKRLQSKALENDTDITTLVNGWIDDYLAE